MKNRWNRYKRRSWMLYFNSFISININMNNLSTAVKTQRSSERIWKNKKQLYVACKILTLNTRKRQPSHSHLYILVSKTCEYFTLHGRKDFADVFSYTCWDKEILMDFLGGSCLIIWVLSVQNLSQFSHRKGTTEEATEIQKWEQDLTHYYSIADLQAMWVASRSWELPLYLKTLSNWGSLFLRKWVLWTIEWARMHTYILALWHPY